MLVLSLDELLSESALRQMKRFLVLNMPSFQLLFAIHGNTIYATVIPITI